MIAFIMTFARNGANGAQPVSPKLLKIEVKGLQRQIHEQELPAENKEQFVQRVKRNRHDRNHACSKKFEFYCLISRERDASAFYSSSFTESPTLY